MRLLHLLLAVCATAVSAVSVTTATSIVPVDLDELFHKADVVAHVRVVSGDTECNDVAIFKGEVLTSFKGLERKGDNVYFGPFVSYSVGGEYIVFLRDSGLSLANHEKKPIPEECPYYSPNNSYLSIMYEGYSVLPIEYTIEIPDGDYGVEVANTQVILPESLESYPRTWKFAGARDERWVRKSDMIRYLGTLKTVSGEGQRLTDR